MAAMMNILAHSVSFCDIQGLVLYTGNYFKRLKSRIFGDQLQYTHVKICIMQR